MTGCDDSLPVDVGRVKMFVGVSELLCLSCSVDDLLCLSGSCGCAESQHAAEGSYHGHAAQAGEVSV